MTTGTPTPPTPNLPFVEEVEMQGHLIDSLILPRVLDDILTLGGTYVLKDMHIGQRQEDPRPGAGGGFGLRGSWLDVGS